MRVAALVPVTLVLAACGGGGSAAPKRVPHLAAPPLAQARAHTVAAGTAHFVQQTTVTLGGGRVTAYSNGDASFAQRRAHVYRIVPGSPVPSEVIVSGSIVYSNANTQAALTTPGIAAWTKLDTRRLTAKQLGAHPDDLGYAIAPAYLLDAVRSSRLVGTTATRARYTATIDPARLGPTVPKAQRPFVVQALKADYPLRRFPATFWLDARGRVRRVVVAYRTAHGTPIRIETRYSAFGSRVDVRPPAAPQDITPRP